MSAASHGNEWLGAEERYQSELHQSVADLQSSNSMSWLTQGSGVFGTIHRPMPSQPWRPVRMRITGTGTMLPEVQVEVASRDKLGQSMSVSALKDTGAAIHRVCVCVCVRVELVGVRG